MNHLFDGSFYNDPDILVVDLQGSGLIRIDAKPPKIIVGVTITHIKEKFRPNHLVFPAILDTGCNKAFEIDEEHLHFWNATPKQLFTIIKRKDRILAGKTSYDIREARIWLHQEPYSGPRFQGPKPPILLRVSDQIRVMDHVPRREPNPRFPLLGLEALVDNNLLVNVDGKTLRFDIYET